MSGGAYSVENPQEKKCIVEMSEPFSKLISHEMPRIENSKTNQSRKKLCFNFFQGHTSGGVNDWLIHNGIIHMAIICCEFFTWTDLICAIEPQFTTLFTHFLLDSSWVVWMQIKMFEWFTAEICCIFNWPWVPWVGCNFYLHFSYNFVINICIEFILCGIEQIKFDCSLDSTRKD